MPSALGPPPPVSTASPAASAGAAAPPQASSGARDAHIVGGAGGPAGPGARGAGRSGRPGDATPAGLEGSFARLLRSGSGARVTVNHALTAKHGPAANPSDTSASDEPDDDAATLHASARQLAQLAPPQQAAKGPQGGAADALAPWPAPVVPPVLAAPMVPGSPPLASLEDLMPGLVRKVAWSGDGRRGALRIEVGSGALSGATLLVEASDGRVDVTVGASPGASGQGLGELEAWRDRIAARLEARGFDVGDVAVRR